MDLQKLLPKRENLKPDVTSLRVLDDIPFLFKDVCGLKLDGKPFSTGFKRDPMAWVDGRPNSAWMLGWKFLRRPLKKGKWGKLLLEPRGTGKSTKTRVFCLSQIIADRDTIAQYFSQNIEMAAHRVSWIRQRLKMNESRFGTFETRDLWGNEAFTVVRAGSSDEPTLIAGGPDKDATGSHPMDFFWDDVVAKSTNRSRLVRNKIIRTFEDTLNERSEQSRFYVTGTIWPHHTLYHEIKANYRDYFEILRIGAWGAAYDENDNVVWGDPDNKEYNYPWFTKEYLDGQQITPAKARGFRGQFMNEWEIADDDSPFESSMLVEGTPPMTAEGKLDPRLAVYMLTDLGQTDRATKGTSETVLLVVARDRDGVVYIVDLNIGRWNSDQVQEEFLHMYHRWENQGLRYATMETRGPGRDAIYHIPKLAMARKEPVPAIIPVPRSSQEDKDSRIGVLYGPFKRHEIRFASDLIGRPHIFRVDAHGMPCGIAAERLMNYSPYVEHTMSDLPDALSDVYAILDRGPLCPEPTPTHPKKAKDTDYQWSVKRAAGKLRPRYVIL